MIKAHSLRMPLYANNRKIGMAQPFNDTIGSKLGVADATSVHIDALVMSTVYAKCFAIKAIQERTFTSGCFMNLILSVILVNLISGKMLNNISTKIDIDQLHAFADAKNRFSIDDKAFENGKL